MPAGAKRAAAKFPADRDPAPVVVNALKAGLPFDRGWRPASPTHNFLAFALARPHRARLEGPGGFSTPVRIAACVNTGRRSFDIAGDGKRPRYAVLIETKRRNAGVPPPGRYDLVSECGWIGRLRDVPLRHVPAKLRETLGSRFYFHVI
jgi:hypothetical protein